MKKLLLLVGVGLICTSLLTAQSKKELAAEVARLNADIAQKDAEILEARKNERISEANAAAFETQVSELQEANATLLNNLKIFTESSKQRSESIGQTLESLRDKEAKLKVINDEFNKNDSIAILVITAFKQTLGENARVGVKEGAVAVELNKEMLFGNGTSASISEEGQVFVSKIAAVLNANPDIEAVVEGQLDSIGDGRVTYSRSSAIAEQIIGEVKDRVSVSYIKGPSEAYQIKIHPRLDKLYLQLRETIKK